MAIAHVSVGGFVTNVVLVILAGVIVALRFYSRKRSKLALQTDDWLILICFVGCIGLAIEATYAAATGLYGVQMKFMSVSDMTRFYQVQFADAMICHFLYGLIKISVVFFYKRIFVGKIFKICANTVIGMILMWMTFAFFMYLFSARGVSSYWNTPPQLSGSQFDLNVPNLIIALAAADIFLDLLVLSLPFPVIKALRMTSEKKVYVSGVFFLGAFCLVSSAVRLYFSQKLFGTSTPDGIANLALDEQVYLWAHIEAYASVITACLPTLAPLLRGGRNLDSLVGSVRSAFSIRSKASTIFKKSSDTQSQRLPSAHSEKEPWKLNQSEGPNSVITGGESYPDIESQIQNPETIVVHKTFVTE